MADGAQAAGQAVRGRAGAWGMMNAMAWEERQERAGDVCVCGVREERARMMEVSIVRRDARVAQARRAAAGARPLLHAEARQAARRASRRPRRVPHRPRRRRAAQKAHPTPRRGGVRTACRARCSAAVRSLPPHRARLCAGRQAAAALCCLERHPALLLRAAPGRRADSRLSHVDPLTARDVPRHGATARAKRCVGARGAAATPRMAREARASGVSGGACGSSGVV